MNVVELANKYQEEGWFTDMTSRQINDEISELKLEILKADKRTRNGKMTRTFNNAKISIATIILEAMK